MIVQDICLSDIPQSARRTGKNGKVYCKIVVDTMMKADDYGNTHTVFMEQTKEERASKEKKVYIGKGKEFVFGNQQANTAPAKEDDLGF